MADTGRRADDDRQTGRFREAERVAGHAQGVLRCCRVEDRAVNEATEMTLVLFIGTGDQRRVSGRDDHHAAVHADVRYAGERIARISQSQVLHAAHGPGAREAGCKGDLHGYLFVDRVLEQNVRFLCDAGKGVAYLGRGSPRIAREELNTGLQCTPNDSQVSQQAGAGTGLVQQNLTPQDHAHSYSLAHSSCSRRAWLIRGRLRPEEYHG